MFFLVLGRMSFFVGLSALLFLAFLEVAEAEELQLEARKTMLSELAIHVADKIDKPIYVAPAADVEVTAINKNLKSEDALWYLRKMVEHSGLTWEVDGNAIWINVGGFTVAETPKEKRGIGYGDQRLVTKTYPLSPSAIKQAQSAVTELIQVFESQTQYQEGYSPETSVLILPDEQGLMITAFEHHHEHISQLIDSLDVVQKQIRVEAVIYESVIGNTESLGVSLALTGSDSKLSFGSGSVGLSGSTGLLFDYGTESISALISALISEAETTVLSTPTLTLLNGEDAYLTVGENIPILTGSEQTESGTPFQTVQRMDVGVTLGLSATLLRNGLVRLEIEQEASSISESEVTTVDVVTSQRQVKTVLLARPGKKVSFGGLIREETYSSMTGLPLISYIPVVKDIFSQNEETTRRTVFNVVLTVEVVDV